MKTIVYNPHWHDRTAGIHDYIVEFLKISRPSIQISSKNEFVNWGKFIIKKRLPLHWNYIFDNKSKLSNFDAWICFAGNNHINRVNFPKNFKGLKIYHIMDIIFKPDEASKILFKNNIDFLLSYSQLDLWHPLFFEYFQNFKNRLIAWPFGYNKRFKNLIDWNNRESKASIMGSIHKISNEENIGAVRKIKDEDFKAYQNNGNIIWSHQIRNLVRSNYSKLDDCIYSYLPDFNNAVNVGYDSVTELNKYKIFINDHGLCHFPPARTYEGCASGSVMLCKKDICFDIFGFKHNENCIMIDKIDSHHDLSYNIKKYLDDESKLRFIQHNSLSHINKFSHVELGKKISLLINHLNNEEIEKAKVLFT